MSQPAVSDRTELDFRALLPREHALWGWVGLPLFAALVLAPTRAAGFAAVCMFAGFGATNALGRHFRGNAGARPLFGVAVTVSGLAGLGALMTAIHPDVLLLPFTLAGFGGLGATRAWRGQWPHSQWLEAALIVALSGVGGAVALAAGADGLRTVSSLGTVAAWQVMGLGFINRQLAAVLPRRTPWPWGAAVAVLAAAIALTVGLVCGRPITGALVLLYPLRMVVHEPPRRARDARKTGLVELGWGLWVAFVSTLF